MSRITGLALAALACLFAVGSSAEARIIFDNGVSVRGDNYGVYNYTSYDFGQSTNHYQAPYLKFNMGSSNTINEISIYIENDGASCAGAQSCTASLTAKLSFAIRAVATPPVFIGAVVDPMTLLFSVTVNPPSQPFTVTQVSARGLNWGLAANTDYELVLLPSAGAEDKWWTGILSDTNQSNDLSALIVGTTNQTAVPEPSSAALLVLGLAAVTRLRRRTR